MRWKLLKDVIYIRSTYIRSVWFISLILWALSSWVVWRTKWSDNYSFELSVVDFILPLILQIWVYGLVITAGLLVLWRLYKRVHVSSSLTRQIISLTMINILIFLLLWPPRSLVNISHYWSKYSDQTHNPTLNQKTLSVLSWNLQRMGELARHKKRSVQKERAQCIVNTIKQLEHIQGHPIEIFAFQETSNQGLKKLERLLSLSCQFVSYHPTHHKNTGGLGICARSKSKWKLNYVRKISLRGTGRWRALFAEVIKRKSPQSIFNLINVHFLPHKIDPQDITSVLISPLTALELFQDIQETSKIQQAQARGLLDLIKDYQDPTLLMGDFNAPPRAGAHTLLKVAWTDVWKKVGITSGATRYFGDLIPLRVDYIYALAGTFLPLRSRVGHLTHHHCSDHLPLAADLKILR